MSGARRQKLLDIAKALPELVKPQVKTTVEGRRIIKGPAVGARQVLAWKKEFADKGMEWPLPEKPAPAHSHGSKGFEKGHKRDREAETRAVAWRAACEQADERIAQHRADQRAKRHSMLNWYDKLFLSPDQLKKRRKAIKATPTK